MSIFYTGQGHTWQGQTLLFTTFLFNIFYGLTIIDKFSKNNCMKPYIRKVNYYETDKMGITHHSNYVRYMEEARLHFLDELGWSFDKLEDEGISSPVISISCNYKKTTTFPDEIHIEVFVEKLSAFKTVFGYIFTVNQEVVFTATSSHCFFDKDGNPVMLKKAYPEIYEDFLKYLKQDEN